MFVNMIIEMSQTLERSPQAITLRPRRDRAWRQHAPVTQRGYESPRMYVSVLRRPVPDVCELAKQGIRMSSDSSLGALKRAVATWLHTQLPRFQW